MAIPMLLRLVVAAGACQALLAGRQESSSTSSVFAVPTASPALNINSSAYDLSQHFCRIFRHASVYADGKIYIDGGNTYVPKGNKTFYDTSANDYVQGMNNHLLVLDLSQNFSNQDSFPYSTLHKGPDVPNSLIEHALWFSRATRKVYQLGGWFSFNNINDPGYKNLPDIPEAAIWAFDIDAQTWSIADDFATVNTGTKVERPGAAGYCDAPSLNMSFVFEGYVQQRSDHDYVGFAASSEFKYLEGMLVLDTRTAVSKPTLTNISVPLQMGSQNFGPRMNGATVHIPVGDLGVLAQIGGQITANPTDYGRGIPNASGGNTNIDMSFIDLFDIETQTWFRQQTFGLADGIPDGRSDICSVVVTAKDNSSFNIFVVAGVQNYDTYTTTQEIWVLTLPTFQWAKLSSRADGMSGHTCHAVGENLLIIGGITQQKSGGKAVTCADHMPAEIFSLKIQNYTGQFDVDGAKRTAPVPKKIVEVIGGTDEGGAYVRAPKVWSDLYLQYVFDPSLSRPSYTPPYVLANGTARNQTTNDTSPVVSDSGPSKSVIIGASVGGVVGALILAAVAVAACIMLRRKRRADEATAAHEAHTRSAMSRHSELPAYSPESFHAKHDSGFGSFHHGVHAVSVPQAEGPAELGPDAVHATPRPYSDSGADVPISAESDAAEKPQGHPYAVSNSATPPGPEAYHRHSSSVGSMGGSYAPAGMAYPHEWMQQQEPQAGQGRQWQQAE